MNEEPTTEAFGADVVQGCDCTVRIDWAEPPTPHSFTVTTAPCALHTAAPDLLAALERLVAYDGRLYSAPTSESGPHCVFCGCYTDEDNIGTEREEHEADCLVLVGRAAIEKARGALPKLTA